MPVFNRYLYLKILLLVCLPLALAACETELPTPPQITVVITAVDNQTLLDSAVAEALTGTAVVSSGMTETALAQGDITLTPSTTPTATITPPPPTSTPIITPSTTPTPTETPTPTFAPYLPNTPAPEPDHTDSAATGRIRILHAWRSRESMPVDVFIDQIAVARSLDTGSATGYQQVNTDAVRVSLQVPTRDLERPTADTVIPPLISSVIQVPAGGSVSVIIGDVGDGLALLPVVEDIAPLASGKTRLNIVHMNPDLLRSNLIVPHSERSLAHNFGLGQVTGAFDIDSGTYDVEVRDADLPDQTLTSLNRVRVDSQVNYLLVLLPFADASGQQIITDTGIFTDYLLFPGSTRRTASDTAVHFVNATTSGIQILFDNQVQVQTLATGAVTIALPFPVAGGTVRILDMDGEALYDGPLGPWAVSDQTADKIVMITDAPPTHDDDVQLTTFLQNPLPAPLRSSIRLIHGLTGTTATLDLEIQSTNPVVIENEFGVPSSEQEDALWSPIIRGVSFGAASDFVVRTPNIFNIRLVLSGTQSVQASLEEVQLIAGGIYDLIALPGGVGVSRLLLLQPDVQTTTIGLTGLDPALVETQVAATVTALAPTAAPEDETPIASITPTATISPVPTNTPRPSNTPTIPIPALVVEPAPPNAASGSFMLRGEGFAPAVVFTLRINEGSELQRGRVGPDGTLAVIVDLPDTLVPGLHTVSVCADCRPSGRQQEAITLFRVANPQMTATATP